MQKIILSLTWGNMLMLPERNFKDSILISRGEATIYLAAEDYEKAYRSAEHLQSVLKKTKRPNSMWVYYAQGIKAVIEKDETSLSAALCAFIKDGEKYKLGIMKRDKYVDWIKQHIS